MVNRHFPPKFWAHLPWGFWSKANLEFSPKHENAMVTKVTYINYSGLNLVLYLSGAQEEHNQVEPELKLKSYLDFSGWLTPDQLQSSPDCFQNQPRPSLASGWTLARTQQQRPAQYKAMGSKCITISPNPSRNVRWSRDKLKSNLFCSTRRCDRTCLLNHRSSLVEYLPFEIRIAHSINIFKSPLKPQLLFKTVLNDIICHAQSCGMIWYKYCYRLTELLQTKLISSSAVIEQFISVARL